MQQRTGEFAAASYSRKRDSATAASAASARGTNYGNSFKSRRVGDNKERTKRAHQYQTGDSVDRTKNR